MTLKELREQLQKALLDARAICDLCEKDGRDFTAEERQKVTGYMTEAKDLKQQVQVARDDADMRKMVAEMGEGLDFSQGASQRRDGQGAAPAAKGTIGQRFVNAEAFTNWMGQFPDGRIPDSTKGLNSPPVEFKSLGLFGRKTLITGSDDESAGAFVTPDYTGIYEPLGRMDLSLRSLVAIRQTTSDIVYFVRQTTKMSAAAPVAEANVTTYSGATGEVSGEKPEDALAFEMASEMVKTIAHWIPATKRALSDASQIRGIIDQELRDDLAEELEDQMLNGSGVGENFTGILNTAGILTQTWDTDMFTTTRKAITALKTTGRTRTPTAWLMNPSDWEAFDLATDDNGRFYWGGPLAQGQRTLWGYPVVESELKGEGSAMLADWRKAVLWDRERATITVSDSHEDFFIRNMVAILAEMRAAFGLIRPSAFIEVDLTSGS